MYFYKISQRNPCVVKHYTCIPPFRESRYVVVSLLSPTGNEHAKGI